MEEDLVNRLIHMRDAAAQASAFIEGMTKEEFLVDPLTRDPCCMNLILIGEAARRIIENWPAFAASHPDFEWYRMTGMRNRVAHGYEDINFEVVWDTLVGELPKLILRVDALLGSEGENSH